jgi:hypothetical protein
MKTLTFEVEVDDQTADRVRRSEEEQMKVKLLIKNILDTSSSRAAKKQLLESMDRLSDEANENGLTEEKLSELLNEIEATRD